VGPTFVCADGHSCRRRAMAVAMGSVTTAAAVPTSTRPGPTPSYPDDLVPTATVGTACADSLWGCADGSGPSAPRLAAVVRVCSSPTEIRVKLEKEKRKMTIYKHTMMQETSIRGLQKCVQKYISLVSEIQNRSIIMHLLSNKGHFSSTDRVKIWLNYVSPVIAT
jgi:hypothetical protein